MTILWLREILQEQVLFKELMSAIVSWRKKIKNLSPPNILWCHLVYCPEAKKKKRNSKQKILNGSIVGKHYQNKKKFKKKRILLSFFLLFDFSYVCWIYLFDTKTKITIFSYQQ